MTLKGLTFKYLIKSGTKWILIIADIMGFQMPVIFNSLSALFTNRNLPLLLFEPIWPF